MLLSTEKSKIGSELYLLHNSLETLILAFITSRIDFGNIIYNGLPDYHIASIQSIQNACAKAKLGDLILPQSSCLSCIGSLSRSVQSTNPF